MVLFRLVSSGGGGERPRRRCSKYQHGRACSESRPHIWLTRITAHRNQHRQRNSSRRTAFLFGRHRRAGPQQAARSVQRSCSFDLGTLCRIWPTRRPCALPKHRPSNGDGPTYSASLSTSSLAFCTFSSTTPLRTACCMWVESQR